MIWPTMPTGSFLINSNFIFQTSLSIIINLACEMHLPGVGEICSINRNGFAAALVTPACMGVTLIIYSFVCLHQTIYRHNISALQRNHARPLWPWWMFFHCLTIPNWPVYLCHVPSNRPTFAISGLDENKTGKSQAKQLTSTKVCPVERLT